MAFLIDYHLKNSKGNQKMEMRTIAPVVGWMDLVVSSAAFLFLSRDHGILHCACRCFRCHLIRLSVYAEESLLRYPILLTDFGARLYSTEIIAVDTTETPGFSAFLPADSPTDHTQLLLLRCLGFYHSLPAF